VTRKNLEEAISEAERFVNRALVLIEKGDKSMGRSGYPWDYHIRGTAESGDCRRASMDLTRALSKLRKY
jgi:hypothetical protein